MQVIKNFSREAVPLRKYFERVMGSTHDPQGKRFVWDYWQVPNQYRHLRTPAYHFFPKKIYEAFHQRLVLWGRENLGCHDISPPWLSCYIDGCEQNIHADIPHGPWAFVFSLSPKKIVFRGGETFLLKPEICNYWENFQKFRGLESNQVFQEVKPHFNQLLVFDPRIPHGVKRVEGVESLLQARLVIHGWFVEPRPFIHGPLTANELQEKIAIWTRSLSSFIRQEELELHGVWSLRFLVGKDGGISQLKFLTNTVRAVGAREQGVQASTAKLAKLAEDFSKQVLCTRFSRKSGISKIVLPVVFQ